MPVEIQVVKYKANNMEIVLRHKSESHGCEGAYESEPLHSPCEVLLTRNWK